MKSKMLDRRAVSILRAAFVLSALALSFVAAPSAAKISDHSDSFEVTPALSRYDNTEQSDDTKIGSKSRRALTQQADLVLIGSAESVRSRHSSNEYGDKLIVSDVSIRPEEVLKGQVNSGANVVLQNVLGGTVGEVSMAASTDPFFIEGERAVLFLREGKNGLEVSDGNVGKLSVDYAGQVPESDRSLEQLREEILSYVTDSDSISDKPSPPFAEQGKGPGIQPNFVAEGHKWPGSSPEVQYFINNPGFNDAAAGTLAQQNAAISNGANVWSIQGRANFRLLYGGTSAIRTAADDGTNVVIVRNALPPAANPLAWAITSWWWRVETNELTDCDIVFYDQGNTFSLTGAAGTADIQSVTTEEFGHFVGLAHSGVNGSSINGTTGAGTISDRTLHLDDMNGLKSLYGTRTIWFDQSPTGTNNAGDLLGSALAVADFFSDDFGVADVAVGAPGEDYAGSGPNAGVVFLYSNSGYSFGAATLLTQSPAGSNESGDKFGSALAAGDLNHDGYPDLAVGAPGEDFSGSGPDAGMVFLFLGTGSGVGSPTLVRQDPTDSHESGDLFGTSLAVGDFNNDGRDDLAVGAPGEAIGSSGADAGAVFYYLGTGAGLGTPRLLTQRLADTSESGDKFGTALAVGDFNGDGYDDLAVGAPGEDFSGSGRNEGVVFVFFGGQRGLGSPVVFGQSPAGTDEAGDKFGSALAAGNFDGDIYADLAVGAPGENFSGSGANEGVVFVFSGSQGGPSDPYVFGQSLAGANESGDKFGSVLAVGDFNGDGFDELAIGAPGEDYKASGLNAGVVFIRQFADDSGGTLDFMMVFGQDPVGANESGDLFGKALAAGKLDVTGTCHLVIGAPGETLSQTTGNTGVFFLWR